MVAALSQAADADLLVLDDASPDGTGGIAEALKARHPRLEVLHRGAKRGLGSAYREGMARALAEGRPAVVEMDADFSHDPRDVPRLLEAVLAGRAGLVIGSRAMPGGGSPGWPLWRRAVSRAGNHYAKALLGMGAGDMTSGFRAYAREALRRADPAGTRSEGYTFQIEMAWRVFRSGGRIAEIPIVFTDRRLGCSKLSGEVVWEAAWRVPALALGRVLPRKGCPRP